MTDTLDLIDAIVYGDAFDAAVTLEEIRRFARVAVSADEVAERLRGEPLQEVVLEEDGFFCLRDRPHLASRRPSRLARPQHLQRRARRVARLLRLVPFVRGLFLTGSAAAGDAAPDADLDLLVVVAPGRLGTVFILLASASRLLGRQVLCPNFYVSEEHLAVPAGSVYVARELAQARGLVGRADALRVANPWLDDMFPNLADEGAGLGRLRAGGAAQRLLEASLRGRLGRRVEHWAGGVARARLRVHYGGEVPPDVVRSFDAAEALRFHGSGVDRTTEGRYAGRRGDVAVLLATAGDSAVVARSG